MYITQEDYKRAEANGISNELLYNRVYRMSWDVERAICQKKQVMSARIEYTAEEKELMKKNNIPVYLVYSRLRDGWDRKKAVSTPKIIKKGRKVKRARSKFTDEIIELVKSNGINISTFYWRVRNGWSEEEAATTEAKW